MNDPKPFASLSSGLLARKGAARPAMRPQGFGQAGASLEDLGWNDMGFEPPRPAPVERDNDHDAFGEDIAEHPGAIHSSGLSPVESPVHSQQAQIAERLSDGEVVQDEDFDETAELYETRSPSASAMLSAPASVEDDEDFDETAELYEPLATSVEAAVNVQGSEPDRPKLSPILRAVPALEAAPAPSRVTRLRSAPGSKAKAAFTLRLAPDRHLKLRLACAVRGNSAQQLVTEALDQLLASMPELDAMAAKANRKE